MNKQIYCSQCGKSFERNAPARKVCSDECRADRRRRSYQPAQAIRRRELADQLLVWGRVQNLRP